MLESSGGCLIKLRDFEKEKKIRCYRYRAPKEPKAKAKEVSSNGESGDSASAPVNADFEAGLVRHSPYNSRTPGAAPALLEKAELALPYVNMLGQVCLGLVRGGGTPIHPSTHPSTVRAI